MISPGGGINKLTLYIVQIFMFIHADALSLLEPLQWYSVCDPE